MSESNGCPAFPVIVHHVGPLGEQLTSHHDGMSLRDYFAAKVMQGFAATPNSAPIECMAQAAYQWADAMLAERAKK